MTLPINYQNERARLIAKQLRVLYPSASSGVILPVSQTLASKDNVIHLADYLFPCEIVPDHGVKPKACTLAKQNGKGEF